jgi:hypothetical protein
VQKAFPRIRVLRNAACFAAAMLAASLLTQLPAAMAAGPADADAREVVRLINGVRAATGKSALNVDLFLASQARDGAIPCPDTAGTIAGRAQDFAAYGQSNHLLRDCGVPAGTYQLSAVNYIDELRSKLGYGAASVGEIIGMNSGYGTGQLLYTYSSFSTWTYSTTGHMVNGWLGSSSHAAIVLGTYDRVGCGAWSPSGSTVYYDCLFARGGPAPSGLAAPPTASPFGAPVPPPAPTPVRTPAPAPVTRAPVAATPVPTAVVTPTPAPTPTATPSPSLVPTAAPTVQEVAAAVWPSAPAPSVPAGSDLMPRGASTQGGGSAVTAASGGAMVAGFAGLFLVFWRRRRSAGQP